jgi:hypothetical protein
MMKSVAILPTFPIPGRPTISIGFFSVSDFLEICSNIQGIVHHVSREGPFLLINLSLLAVCMCRNCLLENILQVFVALLSSRILGISRVGCIYRMIGI